MDIAFFDIRHSSSLWNDNGIFLKLKCLLYSYLFIFVLIGACFLLIITPLDYFIVHFLNQKSVISEINNRSVYSSFGYLFVGLVGPLFEELMFRLGLKPKPINVFINIFVLSFFIFGGRIITEITFFSKYYQQILLSIVTSIIIFWVFKNKIIHFYKAYNTSLITFSIITFGLVHISNIKNLNWSIAIFYPFFVIPQMIMGYFISNLRLKYGFLWGVLLHILINSIAMFFSQFR